MTGLGSRAATIQDKPGQSLIAQDAGATPPRRAGEGTASRRQALPLTRQKLLDKSVRAVYRCGWTHKTKSSER
jgi:hypothetical protein